MKQIRLVVSKATERIMSRQKTRVLLPCFCLAISSDDINAFAAERATGSGSGSARTLNALRRRKTGSYVSRKKGIPTRDAIPHRTGRDRNLAPDTQAWKGHTCEDNEHPLDA